MNEFDALINIARKYCQDNFAYWAERYSKERTGTDVPYSYSDSDYNLFPRYNALSALLAEVETLVGQKNIDLETGKNELKSIDLDGLIAEADNDIERHAMQDEKEKFTAFIDGLSPEALQHVTPLPYRRRLKGADKAAIRTALLEQWNYDFDYWDPVVEISPNPVVFVSNSHLTESDYKSIKTFLAAHAEKHLFEITEEGAFSELEWEQFHPEGVETVYIDRTFNWIIYVSHESTITFGGTALTEFVHQLFADRSDLLDKW
jgi:hypothetical protein